MPLPPRLQQFLQLSVKKAIFVMFYKKYKSTVKKSDLMKLCKD
jgi:hypothetical protein